MKKSSLITEKISIKFYLTQLSLPSFHSWRRPRNKKEQNTVIEITLETDDSIIGNRITKTNSTSKIKNNNANRKNRKEKGSRAENLGENPHS